MSQQFLVAFIITWLAVLTQASPHGTSHDAVEALYRSSSETKPCQEKEPIFQKRLDELEKLLTVHQQNTSLKQPGHPFVAGGKGAECAVMGFLRNVSCRTCGLIVETVRWIVSQRRVKDDLLQYVEKLCVLFQTGFIDERVCKGIVLEFKDEIFGVALKLALSPKEACGYILGTDCGAPYNPASMWNVTFPSIPKPPVVPPTPPKAGSPKLRVLHITDFHYDPLYTPGSNAECGEPLCCRSNDGKPAPGHTGAGMYGDYRNCDSSKSVIDSVFQHLYDIRDQFDYVIFTGDIPAHNVWNQSREDQLTALKFYTDTLKKYLPGKTIFNALGNHESAPVNSYPPPFITGNDSESWLYTALADSWLSWLPEDTRPTIEKWLLINGTDPAGMLKWLINELQDAENKGDKVHILGHIMPGCDCCLKPFSWNYYKIINRYEHTIVEQFFGHSHANYYEMFYDDVTFRRPIGLAYIPGSITTYSNLNPGFRIYEMDGNYTGSTWRVQDYTNYYLNLTEANLSGKAQWQKEYSAKEEFGMPSLFPADWNNLIYKMRTDDALFQKMCVHYQKSAPNTCSTCTGDCRKGFLCNLKTGRNGDPDICKDL